MTSRNLPVKHRQTAQNRLSVHLLAEAAGLSYEDMKARLFHMAVETPLSLNLTRDLIKRIEDRATGRHIVGWKAPA